MTKDSETFLSDPYTTEDGQFGRAFYTEEFGFGRVETREDDGLGNMHVRFTDMEPLDGETSVVAGSIFRVENPKLDVLEKRGAQALVRAGRIAARKG